MLSANVIKAGKAKLRFNLSGILNLTFGILFSGLLWYFANDLSGNFGFLMWIAPVPVLLIALRYTGIIAFSTSFVACFIGKLSWFSYLKSVLTIGPTLIYMLIASLIFAVIVIGSRKMVLKTNAWYAVFAFPVFFTCFEFILLKFAPDGTAGSIAYSQLNYLAVIQVASITGILGISFLLTLIPSAIATAWYFKSSKKNLRYLLTVTVITLFSALLFGIIRIGKTSNTMVRTGLVVLDESFHHVTDRPEPEKERLTTEKYMSEVKRLAREGARLVVLPERAINITQENEKEILTLLRETCLQNKIFLVLGYTNFRTDTLRNSALVVDDNGNLMSQYNKARLIKGLEDQFKPGNSAGNFNFNENPGGVAVCKDLDFPDYINRYAGNTFLAVPAWDFVVDGWLHSRMAILRSVENGFSQVRAARQGRLSINDSYGRVLKEADCSNKRTTSLLGDLPVNKKTTLYARFGEWFGFVMIIWALIFAAIGLIPNYITPSNY